MDLIDPRPLIPAQLTAEELRFLTKEPKYNNVIIDSHQLSLKVSLDDPRRWTVAKTPRARLGMLDRLPSELQFQFFAATPISDLFELRRTNSHAKQLIEQWEPFRTVMHEGAVAVRALLTTGAGRWWTTEQVVNVLFNSRCEFCGEHGEILQLLRLKRCCFRCLSQERELLAVNEGYARSVMRLTNEELATIPHLRTVPQNSFWGFPATEKGWIFDYAAALKVVKQRTRPQGQRKAAPSMVGKVAFRVTKHKLERKERSIQPRPKSTIQARRRQAILRLLSEEVSPSETLYAQHACAIRIFAKTCQPATDTHSASISTIEARHCAGCAFYWNFHSPLPWQYHTLYPHRDKETSSPFLHHLEHCIYARFQWAWIHNPWRRLKPEDMILRGMNNSFQTRSGEHPGKTDNKLFEKIPLLVTKTFEHAGWDPGFFTPQHTWPELPAPPPNEAMDPEPNPNKEEKALLLAKRELAQRIKVREAKELEAKYREAKAIEDVEGVKVEEDPYWDCLVSCEAGSQANWACASLASGRNCLFGGPVAVMMEKHARCRGKGWDMPPLGLGEMYF